MSEPPGIKKIATHFGAGEDDVKIFFSHVSVAFWKELSKNCGEITREWRRVKEAFENARYNRMNSRKSGINRKAAWQPMDIAAAMKILKPESVDLTVLPSPQPAHRTSPASTQPEPSRNGDLAVSTLQFHKTSFQIREASLQTLQPDKWLNDEIVTGTLRLIKEVNNKVEVIDSLALSSQQHPRVNLRTKILLPMLIGGNHWVLGVYEDDVGLLVYDSLPGRTTKEDISDQARTFFSKILERDDINIIITSPLIQVNSHDCGVLVIVAAFHEAIDLRIKPMCVDPCFWREALYRLLRSQSRFEEAPVDTRSAELPRLPTKAQLLEHSEAVTDVFDALLNSFRQQTSETNKRLMSAKVVLEIARHAREGGANADLEDACTRFQQVENYCKTEINRLHDEQRILVQLIGPCIMKFPGTVKTQHINKLGNTGGNLEKLNDALDNRKRGQDEPLVDEPSHRKRKMEQSPITCASPDNHHHDSEGYPSIGLTSPAHDI
ncbi:hypothetical protein V8F06_014461 [Rhypophila decipiens]